MSKPERIAILGARKGGTTTIHGSMITALNCGRLDPEVNIQLISNDLADENRRVMVEGKWPLATPAGGGEYTIFHRCNRLFRTTTVAGTDIILHRGTIRDLQGDLNILVLDPTQDPDVARRSVPARAFWMQANLGLAAGDAVVESLRQHFGLMSEELTRKWPKFMGRVAKLNQAHVHWTHDASQDAFSARYPIDGLNGRDLKPFWRALEDIILGECRKVAYELHLLGAVVAGAEKLIVTFNRVEWLPTLPGVHFDYLALAQKIVAPRPGMIYVAEKHVDYRLANDGESIEQLEGYSDAGPNLLWEAVTTLLNQKPTSRPVSAMRVATRMPRWAAIATTVAIPMIFVLLLIFGGWMTLLVALGVVGLVAAEVALIVIAMHKPAVVAKPAESSALEPAPQPKPVPAPKPKVEIPAAIASRSAPIGERNGEPCSHA
jgi:hypothetical protein